MSDRFDFTEEDIEPPYGMEQDEEDRLTGIDKWHFTYNGVRRGEPATKERILALLQLNIMAPG